MMINWEPTASFTTLRLRARLLQQTREFFALRRVLEVETPLLSACGVTDPHLQNLRTHLRVGGDEFEMLLQTSPEYAMKRLLAAGSGDIFQICKAFRNDEAGRVHNPEFTLIEWYRIGWNDSQLISEVEELIRFLVEDVRPVAQLVRHTYAEAFASILGVDPHTATVEQLGSLLRPDERKVVGDERDHILQLLMATRVEPTFEAESIVVVTDFPASQAALARLRETDGVWVAARFEVYLGGLELANGYWELTDGAAQQQRFAKDQATRKRLGLNEALIDPRLVAALASGLPDCAGVAVGFDRLLLHAAGGAEISDVLAFPLDRA